MLKSAIAFFEKLNSVKEAIKIVDIDKFAKDYADNFSEVDTLYRKVYFYYDNIPFHSLHENSIEADERSFHSLSFP